MPDQFQNYMVVEQDSNFHDFQQYQIFKQYYFIMESKIQNIPQIQKVLRKRVKKPINEFEELTPWNGGDQSVNEMKYFTANIQEKFPKINNNTKNELFQTKYQPKKHTPKFMLTLSKIQLGNHDSKQLPENSKRKGISFKQEKLMQENQKNNHNNHNFVLRNSFYSKLQHKIDNTKKIIKLQDLSPSEKEKIEKKMYHLNRSLDVRSKKQYIISEAINQQEVPIVITQSSFNKLIFKDSRKIRPKKLKDYQNSRYINLNKSTNNESEVNQTKIYPPMMYPYIDFESQSGINESQSSYSKKINRVNIARKHQKMIQIKQIPISDSKSNLLSPKKIYSQKSKISKFLQYYQKSRTSFDQQPYYITNFS